MFRLVTVFSTIALLFFTTAVSSAQQPQSTDKSSIPEKNGVYDDPDHPGIKVRVYVHEPRDRKSQSSTPLSCDDPSSGAKVPAAGWHLPSGSWIYNLNLSSVPSSVGSDKLPTIASNAFGAWNNSVATLSSHPLLTRGSDTTVNRQAYDGLNIVSWGRTSGTALAVTYIRYDSTGTVVDVDTIMNVKFPWKWNGGSATCPDPNYYDSQDILTHESGHWMGLDDTYTSDYVTNTMYGYGSKGEMKKDTLTNGDTLGVQAVYK